MIIAINPGHYIGSENYDPGACNGRLGLREVDINIAVAQKLQPLLEAAGHEVVYIHCGELYEITAASNEAGADLFVSIHCNSAGNESAAGTETFYFAGSRKGRSLAALINAELVGLGLTDRGIKSNGLYVTRHTDAVAVLVELGFLSNMDEGARLGTEDFQQAAAEAIYRGICNYVG